VRPARTRRGAEAATERQTESRGGSEPGGVPAALLARIIAIAPEAVISVDEAHRIILFNEGAERIFGHRAADVIGKPLDVLLPARFRAAHRAQMEAFARSGEDARLMGQRPEITGLRANGEEFPAEASISRVVDGGRVVFTVVLRDISRRRRRLETERFLAEAGTVLASSLDYETTLRSVARLAVDRLADWCVIDMIETTGAVKRLELAVADPALEPFAAELARYPLDRKRPHLTFNALTTGRSELVREVAPDRVDRIAQDERHRALLERLGIASYMAVPLSARGRTLGAIAFITGRRDRPYDEQQLAIAEELARRAALAVENARLYRDARAAVRAREEVLDIVAHDLGNALAAMLMATGMLDEAIEGTRAAHGLEAIRRSAEQMEALRRDLLEVRAIEREGLALERSPVRIASLLDDLAGDAATHAASRSIRIRVDADASIPPVRLDASRVRQAVMKLLGRAIRVTPLHGEVVLRAVAADGEVRIGVSDAGPAIAAEDLPRVFDRSWQTQRVERRGVTLGMAIARMIAEAHGGRAWAESGKGRGTTFWIALPGDGSDTEGE